MTHFFDYYFVKTYFVFLLCLALYSLYLCFLILGSISKFADTLTMSEKPKLDLGLLEEDDEFEEFPAENWGTEEADEDVSVWEDNWEDDNVQDDFNQQLRQQLEKLKQQN